MFYVLERHRELVARTDYLLTAKLQVEQEEVETMRGINKILLGNYNHLERKIYRSCYNTHALNVFY